MDDEPQSDDISQLWDAAGDTAWEPAPLHRAEPGLEPQNGRGHGTIDRLDALERDVRALVRVVERVEALVNERLTQLEEQVAEATATLRAVEQPAGRKGMSRISGVIRSARSH